MMNNPIKYFGEVVHKNVFGLAHHQSPKAKVCSATEILAQHGARTSAESLDSFFSLQSLPANWRKGA
jgi:hypothetical protein